MKIISIIVDALPKSCEECQLAVNYHCIVIRTTEYGKWIDKMSGKNKDCPLKEERRVPEPGFLITGTKYPCYLCGKEKCEHLNNLKPEHFKDGVASYCSYGFIKK